MALSDNLVAYWSLEESSGTRVDAQGPYDLTDNNTVTSAAGKVGTAADFEADNSEYLSIADTADLSGGDADFTIACWVKAESIPGFATVFSKGWGTAQDEFILYANGAFTFEVKSSGGTGGSVADTTVGAGTWYFLVCWHDSVNNQIGIAVNAGTAATTAHSAGVRDGTANFNVGASPGQSLYWDGLIDEVAVWRRVLTSAERTELYNGGSGRDYAYVSAGSGGGSVGMAAVRPRRQARNKAITRM